MSDWPANHIIDPDALSAVRLVFRHFGGPSRFRGITEEIMRAVDKADSAQFTVDEIPRPRGCVLLSFVKDSGTGVWPLQAVRFSNYDLR
jgi:hypothetical protein